MQNIPTRFLKLITISALALIVSACGFHLKNSAPLAFDTIYTNLNLESSFGARLKRIILANSPDTKFVNSLDQADVYLHVLNDSQTQKQLSIDAEGRVEEYELNLNFTFEIITPAGDAVLTPTTLTSIREIPYNERIVQAKESEITRTFQDMRMSLIDQIMRRISAPEIKKRYLELQQSYQSDDKYIESKTLNIKSN